MTTSTYHSPEAYAATAQDLLRKARSELEAGDLLQASEKGWGAAAHAIKSVAQTHGWEHYAHALLNAAAWRISREHRRPRILTLMDSANSLHQNYYENFFGEEQIETNLGYINELLTELEQGKTEVPVPFQPAGRHDRQRIGMLDGALDLRGSPRNRP